VKASKIQWLIIVGFQRLPQIRPESLKNKTNMVTVIKPALGLNAVALSSGVIELQRVQHLKFGQGGLSIEVTIADHLYCDVILLYSVPALEHNPELSLA